MHAAGWTRCNSSGSFFGRQHCTTRSSHLAIHSSSWDRSAVSTIWKHRSICWSTELLMSIYSRPFGANRPVISESTIDQKRILVSKVLNNHVSHSVCLSFFWSTITASTLGQNKFLPHGNHNTFVFPIFKQEEVWVREHNDCLCKYNNTEITGINILWTIFFCCVFCCLCWAKLRTKSKLRELKLSKNTIALTRRFTAI